MYSSICSVGLSAKWLPYFLVAFFALSGLSSDALHAQEAAADSKRSSINLMSFNIRRGLANDGENHWKHRRKLVVETITDFDADIVGTQENFDFQASYILKQIPELTYVGRSRQRDGDDEHCGIFFRKSRFDKLTEGYFWLSKTPDSPGSKSWGSSLPRMATWLKLWDRSNEQSFIVVNTHFDHRSENARVNSAALIRKFVDQLPEDLPVFVMGDFNASTRSDSYLKLFDNANRRTKLVDSFAKFTSNGESTPSSNHVGTFNGFKGKTSGDRIDWIGLSDNLSIVSASIIRTAYNGRYPSDHFPVTAIVRFAETHSK